MENEHYRVALARSRIAGGFIVACGAATLALVALIPLPATAKALAALWSGATMIDAYRRRRRAHEVALWHCGEIEVLDAMGIQRAGRLRAGSFVAPWLTIIRWRPERARFDRTLVILPDMLGAESFRRLRVLVNQGQIPHSS